jgi:hypothetical protein
VGIQIVEDQFANDAINGQIGDDAEREGRYRNHDESRGFA